MNTRHFWRMALLALIAALFHVEATGLAATDATAPNFIVINVDDLGYGDIEPFGCKHHKTPHLNRMASSGRKLNCFYAAPVCSPSRASLMTGCYPKRVLPIGHVLFPADKHGLHTDEVTIAELLKARGYATGIVGKWHLGDQPQWLPTQQGFDVYYGLPYSNDMGPASDGVKSNLGATIPQNKRPNAKSQPPLPLMRGDTVLKRVLPPDQQASVKNYTNEAIAFIEANRAQPFFLYLPHSAVHFPLYPSDEFRGTSENGLFGDWVQEVDWSVGEILKTLDHLKLTDNTLILFTSDNGGQMNHGASNGALRGGKGSTFEGGMRVPTLAMWPSRIPPGTETDAILSMMDVLPTFAALAGGSAPDDRKLDGLNVTEWLTGDANASSPRETFLYYRGLELQAVRLKDLKFHLKTGHLYDLASDIGESTNVADQHPETILAIQKIIEAMDADLGATGVGPGCRALGTTDAPKPLLPQNETTAIRGTD